jgi:hypothetical protein
MSRSLPGKTACESSSGPPHDRDAQRPMSRAGPRAAKCRRLLSQGVNAMSFRSLDRLVLAAALAVACIACGGVARAQAPTPAAIAAAKDLIVAKGGTAMFGPLIPGVIESAKNSFLPTNPQLATPLNQVAAELRREYEPRNAEILDEVATIYAQHFTEQELRDLVAFYRTPLGKKLLTQEPLALDQSLRAAQAWAVRFSDEVLERFKAEMKRKGYNL